MEQNSYYISLEDDQPTAGGGGGVGGTSHEMHSLSRTESHFSLTRAESMVPDAPLERWSQAWFQKWLESWKVLSVIFLLIVLDLIFLAVTGPDDMKVWSSMVVSVFMIEVSLRVYAWGPRVYFTSGVWGVFNSIDFLIVLVSFIITFLADVGAISRFVLVGRALRGLRIARVLMRCFSRSKDLSVAAKHVVSMNRQRYQCDGFDLDLCYVVDDVIAMALPATKGEAFYRNPLSNVARFFNAKHTEHYWIYNLCMERDYDTTKFHNRVSRYPIVDHSVPRLETMLRFCKDVERFLDKDRRNVVGVHCKAGKGRTGTMVSTWLLYRHRDKTANEVLQWFAVRRTDFNKGSRLQGVETPSQSRYVHYFQRYLKVPSVLYTSPSLEVVRVAIGPVNRLDEPTSPRGRSSVAVTDVEWSALVAEHQIGEDESGVPPREFNLGRVTTSGSDVYAQFIPDGSHGVLLRGDCHFFVYKRSENTAIQLVCSFWLHTAFVELDNNGDILLNKDSLDGVFRDDAQSLVPADFCVRLSCRLVSLPTHESS